ncbi:MAG: DNA primase noncatalytic subunit PriX [Candidatus Aenigmatarchaeota archaeon]
MGILTITHSLNQGWINTLLREDPDLVGQEYGNQTWLPLKELQNPIRRSLCANEFVFDIDAKFWDSCYQLAVNLEEVLNKFGIPFLRFTSGNFLHYHVFFDKTVECPTEIWKDYFKTKGKTIISIEDLKQFLRELRLAIFQFIVDQVKPVENASFDLALMKAERHLIRMEGAKHEETNYYKSLLFELPKSQPKVGAKDVVLPDKIEHWQIPEELLYYVYSEYIKKQETKIVKPIIKTANKTEIKWIEQILSRTFSDGRKRLIDLVVLPYLINIKGLDEEQATGLCYNWALKSHEIEPIRINKRSLSENSLLRYIKTKARYVARKGLKPLSKNNLMEWFSDVDEIKKIAQNHGKQKGGDEN